MRTDPNVGVKGDGANNPDQAWNCKAAMAGFALLLRNLILAPSLSSAMLWN
jgi:hypothetical protein